MVRAANLHLRLCRRHTHERVNVAMKDAQHVLLHWPRHRALAELQYPVGPIPRHAVSVNTYPDLMRLTGLIVGHRQLLLRTAAADPDTYRQAADDFLGKAVNDFQLCGDAPELHALNAWLDDQALIARYLAARLQVLKRAVRSHDTDRATVAWVDLPVPDNDRARNAHSHPIPPMVIRR